MQPTSIIVFILLAAAIQNASANPFLQAISSALATIPFAGFPMSMSAGLAGAKLAVGSKLLYYLGFFGRKNRKKKSSGSSKKPGGFMPLPYAMQNAGAGKFGGGGFDGIDPAQLFQALAAQGINPVDLMQSLGSNPSQMMQAMGGGGGKGRGGMPTRGGGTPVRGGGGGGSGGTSNAQPPRFGGAMPQDFSNSLPPSDELDVEDTPPPSNELEEVESFFGFLRDMDDNTCISRLICDIGADPDFLGEFSRNIDNIINSLTVPPESGAHEYMQILQIGRQEGDCAPKFPDCGDSAYEVVKSVAPSVGVPDIPESFMNS